MLFLANGLLFPSLNLKAEHIMHPSFPLLDQDSRLVQNTKKKISTLKTCGNCHDVSFINSHNTHYRDNLKTECPQCHFENGKILYGQDSFDVNGNLKKEFIKLQVPRVENCAACHGIAYGDKYPVAIPEKYLLSDDYHMTRDRGEIFSPSKISTSFMNLKNKDNLNYAWDIHAEREMKCVSCHITANRPGKKLKKNEPLKHLVEDPRGLTIGQYLYRPDHNMKTRECSECHDALKVHSEFPYKKRHLEVLECQSCHSPRLLGTALREIDETVTDLNGEPRREFREVKDQSSQFFNAMYSGLYLPYLFNKNTKTDKKPKIAPFNLITRWYWKDLSTGKDVDRKILNKAMLSGNNYRANILKAFDGDNDGRLSVRELFIDSDEKVLAVRNNLKSLGALEPVIKGEIKPYEIYHGTVRGKWVGFTCSNCHGKNSRFSKNILLSKKAPDSVIPELQKNKNIFIAGKVTKDDSGLILKREKSADYYVLGYHRPGWIDFFGLLILLLTVLGVSIHAGLRIKSAKNLSHRHAEVKNVYLYSVYERVWHWISAIGIIFLMVTGFEIHFTGNYGFFNLENSVYVHNILAVILIVNAFLSLFYHLASSEIKQFIPPLKSFATDAYAQFKYYTFGIFRGDSHPLAKTRQRKLNPLQQVTYLALLNVLLPFQVVTGVIMWGFDKWSWLSQTFGGLKYVAPVHSLGAWFFLSFFIIHIYLTTTGHSIFSNVKAMITGYDEIES